MDAQRLLKLKHDRRDLGFFCARMVREESGDAAWTLRVESPAEPDEFRDHLMTGSSMSLTMVTGDGEFLSGEACVADVSECREAATVVVLSGVGPLHHH